MGDLSITAATVALSTNGIRVEALFGATITAGMVLYLDDTISPAKWKIADANVSALVAGSSGLAIALCGGADGQYGFIQKQGKITIGATVAVGVTYVLSNTVGLIALDSDITATYKSIVGVATSTTQIDLILKASGVQVGA